MLVPVKKQVRLSLELCICEKGFRGTQCEFIDDGQYKYDYCEKNNNWCDNGEKAYFIYIKHI